MADGRIQLKVNISQLPVTDNLEHRLFKAAKVSQKHRNKIFRSNHNVFQKAREEINWYVDSINEKSHSVSKSAAKHKQAEQTKQMNLHKARILQQV